jgi:hypothetical protein
VSVPAEWTGVELPSGGVQEHARRAHVRVGFRPTRVIRCVRAVVSSGRSKRVEQAGRRLSPVRKTSSGLPVGLQAIGPSGATSPPSSPPLRWVGKWTGKCRRRLSSSLDRTFRITACARCRSAPTRRSPLESGSVPTTPKEHAHDFPARASGSAVWQVLLNRIMKSALSEALGDNGTFLTAASGSSARPGVKVGTA